MNPLRLLVLTATCAFLAPFLRIEEAAPSRPLSRMPAWPGHFQGRTLTNLGLTAREQMFLRGFPGTVGRFTDGERDIVMRWVTKATRQLHAAEDCYRGLGMTTGTSQIVRDAEGSAWRCFVAKGPAERYEVCEQIADREGKRWTDVSAWYWATVLRGSQGPWLATTVAARIE
jgi:hypothetical protein